MNIKIEAVLKEEVAFNKEITFTYEGQEYDVTLHWDTWDGYRLSFNEVDEPEWAKDWNNGETLAFVLDGLTDEALEIGDK